MAINNIPVEASAPHQTITVDLDGETFVLQLDWSEREEAWYLAVKDANEIALVNGIKVVSNWPLLRVVGNAPGMPAGDLMAIDSANVGEDPGLDTFGTAFPFVYVDAESEAAA